MKTFILKAVERLKNYSQKLDAKAILFEKSWEVFNETGDKELLIFRTNSELLISRNGIVQKGKWELLDIANLLIDVDNKSYLLNAAYIEEKFLALKLDGTNQFMVMIETDMKNRFSMNSINAVEQYLEDRYKRIEEGRAEERRLEAIRQSQIEKELVMKERSEAQRKRELDRIAYQKAKEEEAEARAKRKEEAERAKEEEADAKAYAKAVAERRKWESDPERLIEAKAKYRKHIFYLIIASIFTIIALAVPFVAILWLNDKNPELEARLMLGGFLVFGIFLYILTKVRESLIDSKKNLANVKKRFNSKL